MSAICKTCGGTDGHHKPSMLDPHGIGAEGHRMLSSPTQVSEHNSSDRNDTTDTTSLPNLPPQGQG